MHTESVRRRVAALALLMAACWLPAAVAADAATAAVTTTMTPEAQAESVSRCFSLRRSEPAAAAELARTVLGAGPLPVETEIKMQSCLGVAAGLLGDSARAIVAVDRIEQLLAQHSFPNDFMLRALSNAGAILHQAGQISRAEVLYLRAYAIAEAGDQDEARITMLTNIALIHADYLAAPDVADGYYRKAVQINVGMGSPKDLLLFYNYAANLARLGRNDEALAALDLAQAAAEKDENQLFIQRLRAERGGVLAAKRQTAQARQLLLTAIAEQEKLSDPSGLAASLTRLSQLQRQTGEPRAALQSANTALGLVEGGDFRRELLDALAAQSAAYAALGQAPAALASATRQHGIELAALKQHDIQLLANLQAQQQDAAGVREIERLKHQSEIQGLAMDRNELLRNGVIIVLSMFVVGASAFSLFQRRVNHQLKTLSTTDLLTGFANRRAAVEWLSTRASAPANAAMLDVVLLIDIDRFKLINDRFGHDVGDLVLTEVSARLKRVCRAGDIVARWGGEEFLVGCPSLSREQAGMLAERMRSAAADQPIQLSDGESLTLTVSIGFAPLSCGAGKQTGAGETWTWQGAVKLADRALYAAKNSGRNAWVGFWSQSGVWGNVLDAVLKDPERAIRSGLVAVASSRPVSWQLQAAMRTGAGGIAA